MWRRVELGGVGLSELGVGLSAVSVSPPPLKLALVWDLRMWRGKEPGGVGRWRRIPSSWWGLRGSLTLL